MKYIRTENGISSVEPFTTSKGKILYEISGCENLISKDSLEEITISQADTIEELCDEFVFVDFGIISDKEYHFKTLEESKKSNALYDRCYGAIWTDKGLIYVAKMNVDGELELL